MSFRQKLYGFLQGRNGPDALSHAMAFMCVALVVVNFLSPRWLFTVSSWR